jgi:hypothetical protein
MFGRLREGHQEPLVLDQLLRQDELIPQMRVDLVGPAVPGRQHVRHYVPQTIMSGVTSSPKTSFATMLTSAPAATFDPAGRLCE